MKSNARVSSGFTHGGTSSNFGDTIANSSLHMSTSTPIQNGPTLRLRKATPADAPIVARMHAQSWAAAYRGILPDTYLDDEVPGERAAHWAQRMDEIDAGDGLVLIAELDAAPIGFVCLANPDANGSVLAMTFPPQLTVTWGCFIDACTTRTRAWPDGVLRSSRKTRTRSPVRGPTARAV